MIKIISMFLVPFLALSADQLSGETLGKVDSLINFYKSKADLSIMAGKLLKTPKGRVMPVPPTRQQMTDLKAKRDELVHEYRDFIRELNLYPELNGEILSYIDSRIEAIKKQKPYMPNYRKVWVGLYLLQKETFKSLKPGPEKSMLEHQMVRTGTYILSRFDKKHRHVIFSK